MIRFILDSDHGGIFPCELFITLSRQSRVSVAFHPNVLEASSCVPFPVGVGERGAGRGAGGGGEGRSPKRTLSWEASVSVIPY